MKARIKALFIFRCIRPCAGALYPLNCLSRIGLPYETGSPDSIFRFRTTYGMAHGGEEPRELGFGEASVEKAFPPLLLGLPASERSHEERGAPERHQERGIVDLRVVGQGRDGARTVETDGLETLVGPLLRPARPRGGNAPRSRRRLSGR